MGKSTIVPTSKAIVHVKDNFTGSIVAQVVQITFRDQEGIMEFVYVNPRPNDKGETEGNVVARITMHKSAFEQLPELITSLLTQHAAKTQNK